MALVSDSLRNTVVFLYTGDSSHPKNLGPAGTGFIVGKVIDEEGHLRTCVVTAGHVISQLRSTGAGAIRFNSSGGPSLVFPLDFGRWILSETTDLAMTEVSSKSLESQGFNFSWITPDQFVTDSLITSWQIGLGDDVFMLGMLGEHLGELRNEPIVRRGGIALLPGDPVKVRVDSHTVKDIHAYLVELWSIGGHSGSPTFIYPPTGRIPGMHEGGGSAAALLGIVQGHYTESGARDGNAGVAVVIPADEISALLDHPEIEEEHQRRVREAGTSES